MTRSGSSWPLLPTASQTTGPIPPVLALMLMVESRARRGQIADIVRKWLTVAEEALLLENNGKERAAVEKWRELFGWRMTRRVSSAAP